MLVEKIDRLDSLLIDHSDQLDQDPSSLSSPPEPGSIEHLQLITGAPVDDDDHKTMEDAITAFAATSTMASSLWEKYSKDSGYTQAVHDKIKPRLDRKMAERRINSFGAVCTPDHLPKGWKALVILPTQQTPRAAEPGGPSIRQTVPWAGVRDNGVLVSGHYTPSKTVISAPHAFAEIGEGVEKSNHQLVNTVKLGNYSLDNYKNGSKWRKNSVAVTETTLMNAQIGGLHLEMAQNDGQRYRDTGRDTEELDNLQDDYAKIMWRVGRVAGETFKGRETGTFWACQRALESAMDPTALKLARLANKSESTHYNWLMGVDKDKTLLRNGVLPTRFTPFHDDTQAQDAVKTAFERDETLATRRQQAAGLFPILARGWMGKLNSGFSDKEIFSVIDEGKELIPHLAQTHRVTPRHIKSIQGLHWQRTGTQECTRSPDDFLATLPLDHMPKDKKEWAGFRKVLMYANDISEMRYEITEHFGQPPENVYKAARRNHRTDMWASQGGSLLDDMTPKHIPLSKALGHYTPGGVTDMARHIRSHLIVPIMKNAAYQERLKTTETPEEAIKQAQRDVSRQESQVNDATVGVAQNWSIRQMADAQTRWHRSLTAMNDHMQDPSLPNTHQAWKGVADSLDLPKGLVARELTSARDLRIQGMKENHCVGGYTDQVLANSSDKPNTLIFSIERQGDKNGTVLSTVELNVEHLHDERKVSVIQNHAYGNSSPSDDALKAGRALARKVKKLPDEAFQEHFDSVQRIKYQQHTIEMPHKGKTVTVPSKWVDSGYDPTDKAARERAFDAFKPILPKALGKSLEALENHVAKTMKTQTKDTDWEREPPF